MSTKQKHEGRSLSDLVDFPLQAALSGTTSKQDDEDLHASVERDGLQRPIEVLPKNRAGLPVDSIFDGHRRKLALVALGKRQTIVCVRYDLATADRATIDRMFLEANSVRRQLDPLAKAFIAAKQMEIEHSRPLGDLLEGGWEADELRDRIGKMLGISGRHLSRLLRVIRTPIEVQAAVRCKQLSIVSAEKVAGLPKSVQDEIAGRIRTGNNPKTIVESVVGTAAGEPRCVETSFRRYLKALSKSVEHLGDGLQEIKFSPKPEELVALESACELNTRLIDRLRRNEQRNAVKQERSLKQLKRLTGGRKKRQG